MKEIPVKLPFSPSFWDLEGLVSPNAQGALRKIHQCVLKYGNSMYDYVPIAFSMFKYLAGTSAHTIQDSIAELKRLNLIFINRHNNKNVFYAINWKEHKDIHDRFVNLNTEARAAGAELAKKLGLAISQIPEEDFSKIKSNPTFLQKLQKTSEVCENFAITDDTLLQKMQQSSDIIAKNATTDEIIANFAIILDSIIAGDEIVAKNAQIIIANIAEKLITAYSKQKLEIPKDFTLVETDLEHGLLQKLQQCFCKNCNNLELLLQKLQSDNNIYNNIRSYLFYSIA